MKQRMPRATYFATTVLMLSMMLVHVSGCATMKLPSFMTEKHIKADAKNPAAKVICIWQPAEGRGLDELPSRGFAGQIVFLTAKSPTPVEVEGDVTVYLFDDHGPPDQRALPLHVFRFVDGSWQTHLIPTAWGPTYQLFIPYVRKGSHRASCSVAVQIDTPDGRRVTSDMANIALTGSESLGEGTSSPYLSEHSRFPAGRVLASDALDGSHVVRASAELASPHAATGPRDARSQTPRFESFSIPYDFRRASAQ